MARGNQQPGVGRRSVVILVLALVGVMTLTACVRRTVTITTDPQGALIWLNDEEIGRSPATVDFLWYGDYDVIARMDGYETLHTHQQLKAPWYQWPGFDLVSESLYPGWIHDERSMAFALTPEIERDRQQLLDDAADFRERTLFTED